MAIQRSSRPEQTSPLTPREFWEHRLSSQFDLRGAGCRILGKHYTVWLYRVRRHIFLRTVRTLGLDITAARVADIGGGTGFYVDLWRRLGVRSLMGVDFTTTATQRLRARYPEYTFVQADIGGPLPVDTGGRFDVISAMDVLFHIMDDEGYAQALHTLGGLLKPGGYLLR